MDNGSTDVTQRINEIVTHYASEGWEYMETPTARNEDGYEYLEVPVDFVYNPYGSTLAVLWFKRKAAK
jgi:hypothetical protein